MRDNACAMTELDITYVRGQFPAFSEPSLNGQAFFENAGGSYTCQQVLTRLNRFYHQRKVQPYAPYEASKLAGAEMDEARDGLAALMGVAAEEVSFGPSTTQNTYVLAQAFRQWLSPGEAIVVTDQDHEANSGPWRRLAEDGIEVREWKIDRTSGRLEPSDLEDLLDENVRLVCFPHCSNVIGEINPVVEITAMAHAAGAFVCVDGVSYAPHGIPNVGMMGPDIYLFSAYKTFGPHQGIMVIRRDLGMQLPNQAHYFNADVLYKRFTPAGPDHAQVAACAGMVDYARDLATHHGAQGDLADLGEAAHDLMRGQEIALLAPLMDYLKDRNDLRILGPLDPAARAPTVALDLGRNALEVATELAGHGIMAGGGDFYAIRALTSLGIDPAHGVLRVSFTHYANEAEIQQLLKGLDAVL